MTSGDNELHTLVGAYVMDAVTDLERARFARHLASCAQCRDEIRELHEAAARLGVAAAVHPRPDLKAQTLLAARRISQLPPAASAGPPAASRRTGAGRRLTRRRLAALSATALVAALTAGATVLGVATDHAMRQLDQSQRQSRLIAAIIESPDAVMLAAKVSTGGRATVVMSERMHALVFAAHGLRALPGSRCYELWLMGPAGDKPAGMLMTSGDGTSGPAVVSGLAAGDMVGLTVEPAAGSRRPTSAPVVLIGPESS